MSAKFPHCDELVLHAPGECQYCDHYPTAQQQRITDRINFTGHAEPGKAPCPAEQRRELWKINQWGGNVARPTNGAQKV